MIDEIDANSIKTRSRNILILAPDVFAIIAALVFLDSLRYKLTNAPETQVIVGKLDAWASTLGASGLFSQTGVFSQYVIGSAELLASILLLVGILPAFRRLQALGAVVAFCVMMGAVNFHLWTPLGIDPNKDGGSLFIMAVFVLCSSAILIFIRRSELFQLTSLLGRAVRDA